VQVVLKIWLTSTAATSPSRAAIPLLPPEPVWPIPRLLDWSYTSFVTDWTGTKNLFASKGVGRVSAVPYVTNAMRNLGFKAINMQRLQKKRWAYRSRCTGFTQALQQWRYVVPQDDGPFGGENERRFDHTCDGHQFGHCCGGTCHGGAVQQCVFDCST
jgi:hypothetical protein